MLSRKRRVEVDPSSVRIDEQRVALAPERVPRFLLALEAGRYDAFAPRGYPEINYLTAPIRAAAREREDADGINLWAGTAHGRAQEGSASELVERWAREVAVSEESRTG